MAKKAKAQEIPVADAASTQQIGLRYVGPAGQTTQGFGGHQELVPGQVYYTADADFAAYLVATHPDYWQRATAADIKE